MESVAKLVNRDAPEWNGSPTELAAAIGSSMAANALTKHLNVNASRLRNEYNISYENKAKHEGRRIRLHYLIVAEVA